MTKFERNLILLLCTITYLIITIAKERPTQYNRPAIDAICEESRQIVALIKKDIQEHLNDQ